MTDPAQSHVYLPFVAKGVAPAIQAVPGAFLPLTFDATVRFGVEQVRLWSAAENGATAAQPCGGQSRVRVLIADERGTGGPPEQMRFVVLVTHSRGEAQWVEARLSIPAAPWQGMVEFELHDYAWLRILTGSDWNPANSGVAVVTALPARIAQAQLVQAGFCHDQASYTQLVAENRCIQQLSWDVMFKRIL